jgi:hypothetical protein
MSIIGLPLNALDRDSQRTLRAALAARAASVSRAWVVASHQPLGEAEAAAVMLGLDLRQA